MDPFGIYGQPTAPAGKATPATHDPFGIYSNPNADNAPLQISSQSGLPKGLNLTAGAPAAGNKLSLFLALNQLNNFNPEEQTQILNRSAQAGLIDRSKASDYIKNSAIAQPSQLKLNPWEKTASVLHGIPGELASSITNTAKQANKSLIQPILHPDAYTQHGVLAKQAAAQNYANKLTPQTQSFYNKVQSPGVKSQLNEMIANPKVNDQQVRQAAQKQLQIEDARNKQGIGEAAQLSSLALLPGGEGLLGKVAANTGAGVLGGVGTQLSNKPTSGTGELFKAGAIGGASAAGLSLLGAGASKAGEALPVLMGRDEGVNNLATNSALQQLLKKGRAVGQAEDFLTGNTQRRLTEGGQHLLPTVSESTLATSKTPAGATLDERVNGNKGGVFGDTLKAQTSSRNAQTKLEVALNNIDDKLAKIDAGEITVSPEERKALFQSRQVLSGNAPAVTQGTKDTVAAAVATHAPSETAQIGSGANGAHVATIGLDASVPKEASTVSTADVPAYTKQVEDTLNNFKSASATSTPKDALQAIKGLFTLGKSAEPVQSDLRASIGQLGADTNAERRGIADTVNTFKGLPANENLQFIQKVQSGEQQATPELQKLAGDFRTYTNQDYALAKTLNPNLPYMDNYFPQSGIWQNQEAADEFFSKFAQPTLGGKPGALEQRAFPSIYDGINAGLALKETNPAIIALNNRVSLLKAKMAQDFIQQQTDKGIDPAITEKVLDRYLGNGLKGSAVYQTVNQAATAINTMQLGLSGFHFFSTGLNSMFSKFGDGLKALETGHVITGLKNIVSTPAAPIIDSLAGKGVIADDVAGKLTPVTEAAHLANFPLGKKVDFATTGLSQSLKDIQSGTAKGIAKGVAAAPFRAMSTFAKPLMEHWVPAIKAGAFSNAVENELKILGPNATQAEKQVAFQRIADSIDNRFGQLTRDNIFWDKSMKDISKVLMRSDAWNIGTVRELGGGVANLAKKSTYQDLLSGKGLPNSTNYVLSLAAGTAMIGTAMNYMFTGKAPQTPTDFFYPKTGKIDKNGNEERVSLPTYSKDVFSFIHNPGQTIANKATPLVGPVKGLVENKDYFGNMVRNPQDSAGTQLKQVGGYLAKQALPFTATNANQRVDKGLSTKAQSFFGLNPAPGYITKSGFQNSIESALNQALGSKSLTPEEQALVTAKSQGKQALQGGNPAKIDALISSGQITQKQGDNLKASAVQTSLANTFNYLVKVDRNAAANLITKASPQDIQKLGDLNPILKSLAVGAQGNSKTQQASLKLLQVLNNSGYNTDQLVQQEKADAKATAAATRAVNNPTTKFKLTTPRFNKIK